MRPATRPVTRFAKRLDEDSDRSEGRTNLKLPDDDER